MTEDWSKEYEKSRSPTPFHPLAHRQSPFTHRPSPIALRPSPIAPRPSPIAVSPLHPLEKQIF